MQEKVEIITNHFEQYWTKIPKNGYCDLAGNYKIDTTYPNICISLLLCKIAKQQNNVLLA